MLDSLSLVDFFLKDQVNPMTRDPSDLEFFGEWEREKGVGNEKKKKKESISITINDCICPLMFTQTCLTKREPK